MHEAKNFEGLLGTKGFSDVLFRNHFTLYEGYVSNTNKIYEFLSNAEAGTPQWNELKRRFGWEWNGMRLHELYFGNIIKGGSDLDKKSQLARKLEEDFGSLGNWEKDFRAIGAMRGIGWAVLVSDNESRKLLNIWVNEHDSGNLVDCVIILVMDVFEHAFALDYGIRRADYINAFFGAIDWDTVSSRFAGK